MVVHTSTHGVHISGIGGYAGPDLTFHERAEDCSTYFNSEDAARLAIERLNEPERKEVDTMAKPKKGGKGGKKC